MFTQAKVAAVSVTLTIAELHIIENALICLEGEKPVGNPPALAEVKDLRECIRLILDRTCIIVFRDEPKSRDESRPVMKPAEVFAEALRKGPAGT